MQSERRPLGLSDQLPGGVEDDPESSVVEPLPDLDLSGWHRPGCRAEVEPLLEPGDAGRRWPVRYAEVEL